MSFEEAISFSKEKSFQYNMDVHIMCNNYDEYFTVIDMNLRTYLNSDLQIDKKIYYTSKFKKD